jgi:Asp-tRNA(Asn)/Glu-tRNA(Gln) amidotransferase B subunit
MVISLCKNINKFIELKGLFKMKQEQLSIVVEGVIKSHPEARGEYLAGKEKYLAFFLGEVLRKAHDVPAQAALNEIKSQLKRSH